MAENAGFANSPKPGDMLYFDMPSRPKNKDSGNAAPAQTLDRLRKKAQGCHAFLFWKQGMRMFRGME